MDQSRHLRYQLDFPIGRAGGELICIGAKEGWGKAEGENKTSETSHRCSFSVQIRVTAFFRKKWTAEMTDLLRISHLDCRMTVGRSVPVHHTNGK